MINEKAGEFLTTRFSLAATFILQTALVCPALSQNAAVPLPSVPQGQYERPVSWKSLVPNIADDQAKIWLFPAKPIKKRNWIPTAAILGTTAALIALDPQTAPYFRKTSAFSGFNRAFSGNATAIGTAAVPVSFYVLGLINKDSKATNTALLAGEAVADTELVALAFKAAFRRERPSAIPLNGNYWDTWFDHKGSVLHSNSSMPSGHTIAGFAIATVIARRYGNHRWVPYVSYGLATAVGFSRVTLSAHFVSDVFVGGALGYSISRFAVMRQ
jgi:membrane-associated phospholipid phosphatase